MNLMARIEPAPEVGEDFERNLDHREQHPVGEPAGRIEEIIAAIDVLASNPLIYLGLARTRAAKRGSRAADSGVGARPARIAWGSWPARSRSGVRRSR